MDFVYTDHMTASLVQLGEVGPLGRGPFLPLLVFSPRLYKLTLPLHSTVKGKVYTGGGGERENS